MGRYHARIFTLANALNLDDVRTHIAQKHAAEWPRYEA
jgi:hypothetical protein